MDFEVISWTGDVEVIASGREIRDLRRLVRAHGNGRWRKLKRFAWVRFTPAGEIRHEEVHWYEAHGIGKREFKIKHRD
jgi:hypothetical protein